MEWCTSSVQDALGQARGSDSGVIAFQVLDESAGSAATLAAWSNPKVSSMVVFLFATRDLLSPLT
jgi:hypothetical protein